MHFGCIEVQAAAEPAGVGKAAPLLGQHFGKWYCTEWLPIMLLQTKSHKHKVSQPAVTVAFKLHLLMLLLLLLLLCPHRCECAIGYSGADCCTPLWPACRLPPAPQRHRNAIQHHAIAHYILRTRGYKQLSPSP
jgi:hypothetical protein